MDARIILYLATALIGIVPIVLLVAAVRREPFARSRAETLRFMEDWGSLAPSSLRGWVSTTLGCSTGFALLVGLSFGFNQLGDASMPGISRVFAYFGKPETAWSVEHATDWKSFRNDVRQAWSEVYPEENLATDGDAWDAWKNERGKNWVRAPRILLFYALLAFIAGLIDILSSAYRKRGIVIMIVGVVGIISTLFIWSDRKAHYIAEVMIANEALDEHAVRLPPSWPIDNPQKRSRSSIREEFGIDPLP